MTEDYCAPDCGLMNEYRTRDMLSFMAAFLPLAATSIAGIIGAGVWWTLLIWLGYAMFFFVVWEARVLCSHCPYWEKDGRILKCHANSGVPKLWRYRPEPMSRSEQVQFLIGAGILVLFPLVVLAFVGAWAWFIAAAVCAASFGTNLLLHACTRCVNFSCPLNQVPKSQDKRHLTS